MHIREGEKILRVYRHHLTPFIFDILKVIIGFIPFYVLLFAFAGAFSGAAYAIMHVIFFVAFILVVLYQSLIYWLDKLIITNDRIIYINWKYLTKRQESDFEIKNIQDVQTHEHGFLSHFKWFDYGTLSMETSSSSLTLVFPDAPNPEGIRQFIYHLKSQ